jgi:hypothetical protein
MKTEIIFIEPFSVEICYIIFRNRDRKFHDDNFVRTHSGCRKVFLYALENYPDINSIYVRSLPRFLSLSEEMEFVVHDYTRQQMLQTVRNIQRSEEEIRSMIDLFKTK